jgi:hypothetical protein
MGAQFNIKFEALLGLQPRSFTSPRGKLAKNSGDQPNQHDLIGIAAQRQFRCREASDESRRNALSRQESPESVHQIERFSFGLATVADPKQSCQHAVTLWDVFCDPRPSIEIAPRDQE